LCADARKFGIVLRDPDPENPLSYWIIYAVVLMASVCIGVFVSAISYDLCVPRAQDPNRTLAWIMYSLCNYGLVIFVILLLRLTTRFLQIDLKLRLCRSECAVASARICSIRCCDEGWA